MVTVSVSRCVSKLDNPPTVVHACTVHVGKKLAAGIGSSTWDMRRYMRISV